MLNPPPPASPLRLIKGSLDVSLGETLIRWVGLGFKVRGGVVGPITKMPAFSFFSFFSFFSLSFSRDLCSAGERNFSGVGVRV